MDALPLAALTLSCASLNSFFPGVLGAEEGQFIWLQMPAASSPGLTSSTVGCWRSHTAVKGAKEIAVVGHTDCRVAKNDK